MWTEAGFEKSLIKTTIKQKACTLQGSLYIHIRLYSQYDITILINKYKYIKLPACGFEAHFDPCIFLLIYKKVIEQSEPSISVT